MSARTLLGVCAVLMAAAIANAASAGEPASSSVVVGLAKCVDCTRKNVMAEAVFKGLNVAIKCKNVNGEYESKAVGKLNGSGAFSVPLAAADLHGADCHAQLHSAATGKPCPGQEPSTIVPQSDEGTFVAVPGKTTTHYGQEQQSPECVSAIICGPIKKNIVDHFHHKLPQPEPKPEYHHPTPTYGGSSSPTPIYHPPALQASKTFCGKIKKHFMDHFHKNPVPEYHPPTPEYHPPTPVCGHPEPTPIYHPPVKH